MLNSNPRRNTKYIQLIQTKNNRLISEAGDLSIDQIGRGRDWSEASKGVLLRDGNKIAIEVEIALNTLEIGLEEEGCGEEGIVYLESRVVEESCDAVFSSVESNWNVGTASRSIVGELYSGGRVCWACCDGRGEESNSESDEGLHVDECD